MNAVPNRSAVNREQTTVRPSVALTQKKCRQKPDLPTNTRTASSRLPNRLVKPPTCPSKNPPRHVMDYTANAPRLRRRRSALALPIFRRSRNSNLFPLVIIWEAVSKRGLQFGTDQPGRAIHSPLKAPGSPSAERPRNHIQAPCVPRKELAMCQN